jgi:hypothetical protein
MKLVRWVSDFGCHFYVSYGSVEPYRASLEVSQYQERPLAHSWQRYIVFRYPSTVTHDPKISSFTLETFIICD